MRDPALSPRNSRDVTGNALSKATPALPENLTEVPTALTGRKSSQSQHLSWSKAVCLNAVYRNVRANK